MKLRRAFIVMAIFAALIITFCIYQTAQLSKFSLGESIDDEFKDNKWLHFNDRISQLEASLDKHRMVVNKLQSAINKANANTYIESEPKNNSVDVMRKFSAVSEMIFESSCPIQPKYAPTNDVQMLDLYKKINFEDKDGGVWKQGWNIEVDEKEWNRGNKLKVFVVPHSHNDPGWIKTFEDYYLQQTKHILLNMLTQLPLDPRRKFIWAEISYFAMFWDELSEDQRDEVKRMVQRNQLEFVSGGWVMNDEANSHWISIINQYTEGHQWLKKNLNYTPQSSWAIDPFGMSATQPILLKEMGLQNMLIQRVHYSVKKQLASTKELEFRWRQLWDGNGKTDMFTHLMPFYSYDVPHTCGPDPRVCCQFDFKRLPGHGLSCPWKIAPQAITENNVAKKAALLLDQYRKKSKLYKTNVLLVPLGDDFRYDHITEWENQYKNYQLLFDYMNSKLSLNVKAQFGTLTDYFDAVHKELSESQFPTLSGDFFTYADRNDHYWSGYYTSRPFYKRMDRVLLSYIRSAETLVTLAYLNSNNSWLLTDEGLQQKFSDARKSHSLFQHHDGVTGTGRDYVMVDYGKKMHLAIKLCQQIIQQAAHVLLSTTPVPTPQNDKLFYNIDDIRESLQDLSEHYQITIGAELPTKTVVIYNSLTFSRAEVVTFYVSTPFVEVLDINGERVKCQISPIFEYASLSAISQTKYQLSFVANMPALSLVTYVVSFLQEKDLPKETIHASIKVYNQYSDYEQVEKMKPFKNVVISAQATEFTLNNARITASFNKVGLLKALKTNTQTVPVHLDFAQYGVKQTQETSGAYLFLPNGNAVPIKMAQSIVNVVEGPIVSFVTVKLPYVQHVVRLYNSPGADGVGLEIENTVDIKKTINFEMVMRLSTNINSTDEFFTDLNGFQILKRQRFSKLPIQANYYPIPTMAYIEDESTRLTIVTSTPLGCSSLNSGQIEVMLDRRLNQDDNRGLAQGVTDNLPTRHIFRVLLEKKTHPCKSTTEDHKVGFPTLSAHVASQSLLNPLIKLLKSDDEETKSKLSFVQSGKDLGVDFSMPVLRTGVNVKGKDYIGLVTHRNFVDVCFAERTLLKQFPLSHGTINISDIFPNTAAKLFKTSLSYLYLKEEVDIKSDIAMCPMDIQAFVLKQNS